MYCNAGLMRQSMYKCGMNSGVHLSRPRLSGQGLRTTIGIHNKVQAIPWYITYACEEVNHS